MGIGRFACVLPLVQVACATPPAKKAAAEVHATDAARRRGGAPPTRTEDIVDVMHGEKIPDPYRWLEDGSNPEVVAWVEAQNTHVQKTLDLPIRQPIRERLEELLSIGTLSTPEVRYPRRRGSPRIFYTRREGTQNQPVLYVRDGLGGKDRPLVDPNALNPDGTAALDWWYPSRDGKLLAYGISLDGSEWSTLRVRDVDKGEDLPDEIGRTRACSLAWRPDGRGFYYTRYPEAGHVPPGEENYNRHVFTHTLGADPASDPEIFGAGRAPNEWPIIKISPDGRRLLIVSWQGWSKSEIYLLDLTRPGTAPVPVVEKTDAIFDGELLNDRLYVRTNDGAPSYRLYVVDPRRPGREGWREIVREEEDVLDSIAVVGRRLVAGYLHKAQSQLRLLDLEGRRPEDLPLPTIGTVTGIGGEWDGPDLFVGFTSYAVPPQVHHRDLESGQAEVWERVHASVDTAAYDVKQVFFPSGDGTEISMFLVHRKGLRKDGIVPTVLYGYGGFNVSLTPTFNRWSYLLLEHGGLFAVANLRGGGEYGEAWHQAGMLGNKQNVFDDFYAAAYWLIEQGYTSSDHLAIAGRSNGGLLVGAAITQRPRLFKAALCGVPLLDMLRYHHFLVARLWIPELGSAEDPEAFRWLRAYSPYHHVERRKYPAVLITTGEGDSRVEPSHGRKFAARLQAATQSTLPVLLRTDTKAGHGQGKPLAKLVAEATDEWTFLFWQLGIQP